MGVARFRQQQTLAAAVRVSGYGLFCGEDVTVELRPAAENTGIVFRRIDHPQPIDIPATIENVVPQPRCTVIGQAGQTVSVVEHLIAALAAMHIDNCIVEIDAPEPPIGDGSSLHWIEAINSAGIASQHAWRDCFIVEGTHVVTESNDVGVAVQPAANSSYEIGFVLNYGPGPIGTQSCLTEVSPKRFQQELASCRTFVLSSEVEAIQAQGIGLRATPQNLLVFTDEGPIENELRHENECVRHKILDCVGDFALIGCDLVGRFTATCSGHRLNHALTRTLRSLYLEELKATRPATTPATSLRAAS